MAISGIDDDKGSRQDPDSRPALKKGDGVSLQDHIVTVIEVPENMKVSCDKPEDKELPPLNVEGNKMNLFNINSLEGYGVTEVKDTEADAKLKHAALDDEQVSKEPEEAAGLLDRLPNEVKATDNNTETRKVETIDIHVGDDRGNYFKIDSFGSVSKEDYDVIPVPVNEADIVASVTDCNTEEVVSPAPGTDNGTMPTEAPQLTPSEVIDEVATDVAASVITAVNGAPVQVPEDTIAVVDNSTVIAGPSSETTAVVGGNIPAGVELEKDLPNIVNQAVSDAETPLAHSTLQPHVAVDMDGTGELLTVAPGGSTVELEVANIDKGLEAFKDVLQYRQLLIQSSVKGISKATATFLRVGLEMHKDVFKENALMSSMESYGMTTPHRMQPAAISLEDLKEMAKKAIEWVREAIKRLIAIIKTHYRNYQTQIESAKKALNEAKEKLNESGTQAKAEEIVITANSNLRGLLAEGEFIPLENALNWPGAIATLQSYYGNKYVMFLDKLVQNLVNFNIERDDISKLDKIITKFDTSPLAKLMGKGFVLPGNVKVEVDPYSVWLEPVEDVKDVGEVTIKPRTVPQLKKDVAVLELMINSSQELVDAIDKVSERLDKISNTLDTMEKKMEKVGADETTKQAFDELVAKAGELVKQINPKHMQVVKNAMRYTVLYSHLIKQMVK